MKAYIINTETLQWPIYQGEFEHLNPGADFNNPQTPYASVYDTPPPTTDVYTQRYNEVTPVKDTKTGQWNRKWNVTNLTGAELEAGLRDKAIDELRARGIPVTVTMRQARLQLLALNKYDTVNTAIKSKNTAAQIEWEYATEVDRFNPIVPAMQTLLGWTDAQMDTYFVEAAKL